MTRRTLLTGALPLGGALAQLPTLIKPKALRTGDTVGLITPSTYISNPDSLQLLARTMDFFKLSYKFGRNVRKRNGYLGGSIDERVSDLHDMFRDPEVKAVFAIRGGYGAAQLLHHIDYDLIRRNPKIFLGYSDITALHLAFQRKAGLVTFHGPMGLARFTEYTQEHFRKALFDSKPLGELRNPPDSDALRPEHTTRTVRPGVARGRLTGGNLTLISTTLGTPYEIDTRGKILFIEDIDEQPYSIDRMLTHLRLAGKFDQAAGIIFGECTDCRPRDFKPSFESNFSLGEILDDILGKLEIPVLFGMTIGHTEDQLTLPLGVMAILDAGKGSLTLEESATV